MTFRWTKYICIFEYNVGRFIASDKKRNFFKNSNFLIKKTFFNGENIIIIIISRW